VAAGGVDYSVGIADSSWPLTANMVGHSHSVGFYENSYAEIDGAATGAITSTTGDVIQLMLRFATDRLFARKNNTGTWQIMNWTGPPSSATRSLLPSQSMILARS
jgi:hypothetical protein